jgi:hypothetical protein
MSESTELVRGHITASHEITVELRESEGSPAMVVIVWPAEATLTSPAQLPTVATKAQHILARATIRLAQIKRDRKL